jgi:hypothetical protein
MANLVQSRRATTVVEMKMRMLRMVIAMAFSLGGLTKLDCSPAGGAIAGVFGPISAIARAVRDGWGFWRLGMFFLRLPEISVYYCGRWTGAKGHYYYQRQAGVQVCVVGWRWGLTGKDPVSSQAPLLILFYEKACNS